MKETEKNNEEGLPEKKYKAMHDTTLSETISKNIDFTKEVISLLEGALSNEEHYFLLCPPMELLFNVGNRLKEAQECHSELWERYRKAKGHKD
ncbi:MAG: hypothetical protein OEZ31_10045 [Nitrospirota bacterium]|nr:hypothetical protein [Nitrospirota bacterium]MDH5769281.1 hypothetical protein [Nitrospirota bacterium]